MTTKLKRIECVFAADIHELDLNRLGEPFDVICLFQVLEHLDRLPELFGALHRLAAPGALLMVSVPNAARTAFFELNGALLDMPPNHIGRWSKKAFESLEFGWELVDLQVSTESWFAD